jgi:hypothetical protein
MQHGPIALCALSVISYQPGTKILRRTLKNGEIGVD